MKTKLSLSLAGLALLAACQNKDKGHTANKEVRTEFFNKSGMDTTVNPGDNFFLYANGQWMKKTEIPKTERGWGSFYSLYDDNIKALNQILTDASKEDHTKGSLEQKVGDFYASGMDTLAIEKAGYTPLKPVLAKIDGLKDYKELINFIAEGYKDGNGDLLDFHVGADDKISSKNAVNFSQSGITLPERSYYFNNDAQTKNIRAEFLKYITQLFVLTGAKKEDAAKYADNVLKLETSIANSHSTPVELRDPQKNYNKYYLADFQKLTPDIDWKSVLGKLEIKTDTILVGQPKYYQALNNLFKTVPIETWKEKLKFDAISSSANALSKDFRAARFDFFGKTINGLKEPKERWKTIVGSTDQNLGELLGQLYVKEHFTPEAKKRMLEMVDNLQKVYRSRIEKLDWMSPATKQKAIEKLNAFIKKIGYPDKWKKYDDVEIAKNSYFANIQSAEKHTYKEMVGKMGKPVDKTEWDMTPPTVNAYYNPSINEIVFPAGILQFPFFDFGADNAINYGAIGAVIGHEMTHGFDDQGRQYDKDGNLKDWWTAADAVKFNDKAKKVADLYNSFTLLDNQHVNGQLTLGENLADIGGLAIAYEAFKLTPDGKSDKKIDGFTPDQRFFLSFAQVWRIKSRDESMRVRLKTDPHSPEMFRVNGPVYSMEAFYKAFNIPATAKMYVAPANRVGVW
ncbi:M13 family metallopeptidase [Pedobacter cryoconitis]|uniref:Putative endopeptidase n=1 Tax=Pedobacter cryoconitis TaxID=188932 RepID=A0A7X0IZG6_9SPHI|nr:M13 family metallopeptidase [Pedobacter cryoconitis]MBB6498238.1 putative endopeptidase [Pedobacter cryoconitis]